MALATYQQVFADQGGGGLAVTVDIGTAGTVSIDDVRPGHGVGFTPAETRGFAAALLEAAAIAERYVAALVP